ncbi:M48 family metalloprotease [Micromonospora sp. LOL_024]|uniref:M48 family metalloprotease n=1 Tax=Micromonospora sp. LOL_024 TaxID=3345412 RepID=UPI003A860AD9
MSAGGRGGTAAHDSRAWKPGPTGAALGWLRGLLAVALLAGVYVLAFILVTVNTVLVVLTLWAAFTSPTSGSSWTLVVGGSISAVCALLYGVASVSRAEEPPPGAVIVPRREAPELWRLVEELADQLAARPPTRIYLTPEVNAAVSEEARLLGFAVGERTMYLGVPLLTQLTPAELRAVLCHEFGHYTGRHTRFGAVTYRGAASLHSALFRLRMTVQSGQGISGYAWFYQAVVGAYTKIFLWVSLAVRRHQELEADARAAAMVGPAVTAEALRRVHALGHAWNGFLNMFVRPVQRLGFVPDDLFGTFAVMLDDPVVRERLAGLQELPVETNRSWLDSHPPLAHRLRMIETLPAGDPGPVDAGPLLAGRAPMLRVQQKMFARAPSRPTGLPQATWADVVAEAFAVELASLLLEAARGTGMAARPTLSTVLGLLEHGKQAELTRRLTDAPEPEQQLTEALYALVGQALAGAGRARWALSWTRGYVLVPGERTGQDLEELVAAAARDGSAVRALRRDLARRGVDVREPVPLLLRTVSAPAGRTTGVHIAGGLPDFIADEVKRQRTVRTFTVTVLLVLAGAWGITLIGSDGSERYPRTAANIPGNWPSTPKPTTWAPLLPTDPLPTSSWPRPFPSFALRSPILRVDTIVVERGDTLTKIACRHGTTVKRLQEINDMGRRTAVNAGQRLLVPAGLGPAVVGKVCR